MTIENLSQLKKEALNHSWELYCFNSSGIPTEKNNPHKFLNIIRKVVKVQTNGLYFEGGSWLDFPKASQCTFHKYVNNDSDTILTINAGCNKHSLYLSYHLRKI